MLGYTMSRASVVSATLRRSIFCDDTETARSTVPSDGLCVDVTKRRTPPLACSRVLWVLRAGRLPLNNCTGRSSDSQNVDVIMPGSRHVYCRNMTVD